MCEGRRKQVFQLQQKGLILAPLDFLFAGAPLWIGSWSPPLARAVCTRSTGLNTDPPKHAEMFDQLLAPPGAQSG